MKGFIEVTNEKGTKHLINIRHIEEVMNSTIYLDVVNPHCDEQDHIFCEESYKKIIVKIAKAVGEDKRLIPQKPDIEGDGYDENGELIYDTGFCPNCRHEFEIYYDATKYCPNCGQKLDWSNVKDLDL